MKLFLRLARLAAASAVIFAPLMTAAHAQTADPFERFDRDLGLWWTPLAADSKPGVPARRHNLIDNSGKLSSLAQLGRLREVPVAKTLAQLRAAQCLDGSKDHGNFKFWREDARVTDRNASFFIGLNLAVLRLAYADQCTPAELAQLDALGRDLSRVFDHEVAEGFRVYPNKYLGDLVCAWLLAEWFQRPPSPALVQATRESAAYWIDGGWGWGEHLSDLYTEIMFEQLGTVLALAHGLPPETRRDFEKLRDHLLAISSDYAGGPRVPNLRSYAFEKPARLAVFHDHIRSWKTWDDTTAQRTQGASSRPTFGKLFHDCGQLLTPPPPRGTPVDGGRFLATPCENGASALAWIGPDSRLGGMTRFPIFPEHEHPTWGLSWQGFPVAFADAAGAWGFLRWRASENGVERSHPALTRSVPVKALSATTKPAPLGRTETRMSGRRLVALRVFPKPLATWDHLADAVELLGFEPENVVTQDLPDGAQQLTFTYAGRTWTLGHHPLGSGRSAEWTTFNGEPRWDVRWNAAALKSAAPVAHLWWITPEKTLAPKVTALPIAPDSPRRWRLEWSDESAPPWQLEFTPGPSDALFAP